MAERNDAAVRATDRSDHERIDSWPSRPPVATLLLEHARLGHVDLRVARRQDRTGSPPPRSSPATGSTNSAGRRRNRANTFHRLRVYNAGMHTILIAGAALVGLPILLHLIMKQEPKRLTFPAFRFLTQKLKTNQRKLRLRHFILLALRMLLIALFCLALYQPTLLSERLNLSGEQPVATVIVIDTSPSMGYTANEKTRFEEAQPPRARTARHAARQVARRRRRDRRPRRRGGWTTPRRARRSSSSTSRSGGSQPVTSAVAVAYQLLGKIETDVEEADRLPKLVAVFTDRTAASWDAARAEEIKKLQESLPDPKPAHIVFDVGADHPDNVAILAAEMKPQVLAANEIAHRHRHGGRDRAGQRTARGGDDSRRPSTARQPPSRRLSPSLTASPERSRSSSPTSSRACIRYEFQLAASDRLMSDNERFLTFKVGAARLILTIAETEEAAEFWQRGHIGKDGFGCLVVTPNDVIRRDGVTLVRYPNPENPDGEPLTDDIRAFDVVCLLGIRDPSIKPDGFDSLWAKVRPYVERGGKLIIVPADERLQQGGLFAIRTQRRSCRVRLQRVIDTRDIQPPPPMQTAPGWPDPRDGQNGVRWFLDDDKVLQHPMLRPFLEWRKLPSIDVWVNPRVARKYWEVEKADGASVIVHYNDSADPAKRRPAVLERGVPDPNDNNKIKGKVILLTTRLDTPPARVVARLLGERGVHVVRGLPVAARTLPGRRHRRRQLQPPDRPDHHGPAAEGRRAARTQGGHPGTGDHERERPHGSRRAADRTPRRRRREPTSRATSSSPSRPPSGWTGSA